MALWRIDADKPNPLLVAGREAKADSISVEDPRDAGGALRPAGFGGLVQFAPTASPKGAATAAKNERPVSS
jgi:hypothetical protein